MKQPSLFFPLLLIIVGGLWFLNSMDWFPATASIVAALFFIAGCLILLLDGINKQSIVQGPLLMYVGAAVYLIEHENAARSPLQPCHFTEISEKEINAHFANGHPPQRQKQPARRAPFMDTPEYDPHHP